MRVWDIPPDNLCRQHLLGQHREIHAIWNVITKNKRGYSKHPEVLRWKNHLMSLYFEHELTALSMLERGYNHNSPINLDDCIDMIKPSGISIDYVNTVEEQKQLLKLKGCECQV